MKAILFVSFLQILSINSIQIELYLGEFKSVTIQKKYARNVGLYTRRDDVVWIPYEDNSIFIEFQNDTSMQIRVLNVTEKLNGNYRIYYFDPTETKIDRSSSFDRCSINYRYYDSFESIDFNNKSIDSRKSAEFIDSIESADFIEYINGTYETLYYVKKTFMNDRDKLFDELTITVVPMKCYESHATKDDNIYGMRYYCYISKFLECDNVKWLENNSTNLTVLNSQFYSISKTDVGNNLWKHELIVKIPFISIKIFYELRVDSNGNLYASQIMKFNSGVVYVETNVADRLCIICDKCRLFMTDSPDGNWQLIRGYVKPKSLPKKNRYAIESYPVEYYKCGNTFNPIYIISISGNYINCDNVILKGYSIEKSTCSSDLWLFIFFGIFAFCFCACGNIPITNCDD